MKPFGVIYHGSRLVVYWPDGSAQYQGDNEKLAMTDELKAQIQQDRAKQAGKPQGKFGPATESIALSSPGHALE